MVSEGIPMNNTDLLCFSPYAGLAQTVPLSISFDGKTWSKERHMISLYTYKKTKPTFKEFCYIFTLLIISLIFLVFFYINRPWEKWGATNFYNYYPHFNRRTIL